jgi:hypothetical protein
MNMVRSQAPATLWEKFLDAHGPEVIWAAYRRSAVPPVRGERVWEFWEDGALLGWGSLTEDVYGPTFTYRAGVFPGWERQGYRDKIRRLLVNQAFSHADCRAVHYGTMMSNLGQVRRLTREAMAGAWGELAGATWLPAPGMLHFVLTRDRYETVILKQEEKG